MVSKYTKVCFLLYALTCSVAANSNNLRRDDSSSKNIVQKLDQLVEDVSNMMQQESIDSIKNEPLAETSKEEKFDSKHRSMGSIIVKPITGDGIGIQSLDQCNILSNRKWGVRITPGSHNFLKMGKVHFGEKFDGLQSVVPKGVIGLSDHLAGVPFNPLTLTSNFNDRENLYVEDFSENRKRGIQIKGRGPAGFKGPGSISAYFKKDVKSIELSFRADGASKATALFFRRDGSYIDNLAVDIETQEDYSFLDPEGKIAGIAIFPLGDALTWHKFSLVGFCYTMTHHSLSMGF